jgi:putative peptide zinc metalloprotease protein
LTTLELATCRLKLSGELVVEPQEYAGDIFYHLELPSHGKFFRVSYPEYVFISLLDGHTTLAQALTRAVRALGPRALTQPRAAELATWLLENGLAHVGDGSDTVAHRPQNASGKWTAWQRLNPFWIRVPLFNPDRLLTAVLPSCGWLCSRWMTLVGLMLMLVGASAVGLQWGEFRESAQQILSPHNWLSLGLCWVFLRGLHELAHALTCKRFGGEVREVGLVLVLAMPAAYVDVTSSWRFPSKWQRVGVVVAGMYAELVVAALAAIAWSQSDSALVRHTLFNMIAMASVSTLLFNGNPLMRFDGYYLLADLLEIPNLSSESQQFVRQLGTRLFLGHRASRMAWRGWRGWVVRVYGLAALVWRLVVCGSLFTAAVALWRGPGLLLGIAGIAGWLGRPGLGILRALHRSWLEAPLQVVRAGCVSAGAVALVGAALAWVPWPAPVAAPVIVEYGDLSVVRNESAGFIARIHVRDGQSVVAGQLLLELRNDDLTLEQRELQSQVAQAAAIHDRALNERNATQARVALRNQQALQERLQEKQRQCAALQVRAPVAGRVLARDLRNSLATYVEAGTELAVISDERRKQLHVSIADDQVDAVTPFLGESVRVRCQYGTAFQGTLSRIEPRASRDLTHPALSAAAGGPLAVTESTDKVECQLVTPRFRGVITLAPDKCDQLFCGQRGLALFGWRRECAGERLWNLVSQLVLRYYPS